MAATHEPTPEELEKRAAALARVRKLGDPVLRERARPVAAVDDVVRDQIREMRRLLEDAMEAGLAATQLGVLNRVFVYRAEPDGPVRALVNPELEWTSDETEVAEEGCLSIPGVWIEVERPARVRMRALDEGGEEVVIEADGTRHAVTRSVAETVSVVAEPSPPARTALPDQLVLSRDRYGR
jgi:peptide deformylase